MVNAKRWKAITFFRLPRRDRDTSYDSRVLAVSVVVSQLSDQDRVTFNLVDHAMFVGNAP
jgi:hypothetical protein